LPIEEGRYLNRMVWAAPRETPPALAALHEKLAMELYREEFILERRPFAAHVTLIRDARRAPLPPVPDVEWPVREFLLVRSSVSSRGATYEPLERFTLQP
jgi:RNA 2',3'-cyclic 3'-phosphodiesterase